MCFIVLEIILFLVILLDVYFTKKLMIIIIYFIYVMGEMNNCNRRGFIKTAYTIHQDATKPSLKT